MTNLPLQIVPEHTSLQVSMVAHHQPVVVVHPPRKHSSTETNLDKCGPIHNLHCNLLCYGIWEYGILEDCIVSEWVG